MKITLPDFLVIGVEKGGTTWLHAQLRRHPEIFVPETKEIHFFNKFNSNFVDRDNYQLGLDWYRDFFTNWSGQKMIGEITPMYICDPEAPLRIKNELPDVKLIALLRNPIHRAYSHYWMAKNKNHTSQTFDEVIAAEEPKFIKRGLYAQQLEVYYNLFDSSQIKVLFYEEVMKDPEYWLADICRFLHVDDTFYNGNEEIHKKVFESSAYKSPGLLNLQNKVVHTIRRNRLLGKVMNWLKSTGITNKIKNANKVEQSYPKISADQIDLLTKYYKSDLNKLAVMLNGKVPY